MFESLYTCTSQVAILTRRKPSLTILFFCTAAKSSARERLAFEDILKLRAKNHVHFEEVRGAALKSLEPGLKSTIHDSAIFFPDVQCSPNPKGLLSALFKEFQVRMDIHVCSSLVSESETIYFYQIPSKNCEGLKTDRKERDLVISENVMGRVARFYPSLLYPSSPEDVNRFEVI